MRNAISFIHVPFLLCLNLVLIDTLTVSIYTPLLGHQFVHLGGALILIVVHLRGVVDFGKAISEHF
jgi:hypothetical protein